MEKATQVRYIRNGEACEALPIRDRGLHYGDGVFETMAVREGRIAYWGRHIRRLRDGADRIGIPMVAEDTLLEQAAGLCGKTDRGVLKIMLTRGAGGRGYRVPDPVEPTCLLGLHPDPGYPAELAREGVSMTICSTRLGRNPALAGIKHMNRLEQVMARSEWTDENIAEGLMLDVDNHVICGTMSNVFIVNDGYLGTPDLSFCGVNGIMRDVVLEFAHHNGIPSTITSLTLDDVEHADEIFVTNSLVGIWPVKALAGREVIPGPVTRTISTAVTVFGEPAGE